ncbi:dipeptidylpeptidase [Spiromyces aspiralis]|uniref:Dipeptidylpeptidase n=1 Tax=Spiromyces aspiralis TaxID=68401 RepID=A0ACC1HHS2_9FUNG|nr:dipeptidylpeptidase [Spiromyces aspiralis]
MLPIARSALAGAALALLAIGAYAKQVLTYTHMQNVKDIQYILPNNNNSYSIIRTDYVDFSGKTPQNARNYYYFDMAKDGKATDLIHKIANPDFYNLNSIKWLDNETVVGYDGMDLYTMQYPFTGPRSKLWTNMYPVKLVGYVDDDDNTGGNLYFEAPALKDGTYTQTTLYRMINDLLSGVRQSKVTVYDTVPPPDNIIVVNGTMLSNTLFKLKVNRPDSSSANPTWTVGDKENPVSMWSYLPSDIRNAGTSVVKASAVSRDGNWIAQVTNTYKKSGVVFHNDTISVSKLGNSDNEYTTWGAINPEGSVVDAVYFSPNSKYLAWVQNPEPNAPYTNTLLYVYDLEKRNITVLGKSLDRPISNPAWSVDSDVIFATVQFGINARTYRFSLNPNEDPTHYNEKFTTSNIVPINSQSIIFTISSATFPAQIARTEIKANQSDIILNFNEWMLDDKDGVIINDARPFEFTNSNGTVIQGMLYTPHSFTESGRYPLIIIPHEYPDTPDGNRWVSGSFAPQVYASAGYVVAQVNFQGTRGYGNKFAQAIYQNWGRGPAVDIADMVNTFDEKFPYIDCTRIVGVGSYYGAYLGMYMTGLTDNFLGWVLHSGIFDLNTYYWSIHGGYRVAPYFGGGPNDSDHGADRAYRANNPALMSASFKTPVLIAHGGDNHLVDYTQSFEYFVAVQNNGVANTQYVFYSNSTYELTTQDQIDLYERQLAWITARMGANPTTDESSASSS